MSAYTTITFILGKEWIVFKYFSNCILSSTISKLQSEWSETYSQAYALFVVYTPTGINPAKILPKNEIFHSIALNPIIFDDDPCYKPCLKQASPKFKHSW